MELIYLFPVWPLILITMFTTIFTYVYVHYFKYFKCLEDQDYRTLNSTVTLTDTDILHQGNK